MDDMSDTARSTKERAGDFLQDVVDNENVEMVRERLTDSARAIKDSAEAGRDEAGEFREEYNDRGGLGMIGDKLSNAGRAIRDAVQSVGMKAGVLKDETIETLSEEGEAVKRRFT
ncbi:hypothetical protein TELCIR_23289 [Teladorsagia circumcincta]|uniref:Uncharacterized protein n=1 Tax=Teladorsagia circumcincta TaxID=45464 RepID=A0A2G9TBL6_TELCI|nr:hypothetical protein TELCIR_23289 [Teladorsagia circumcincta]